MHVFDEDKKESMKGNKKQTPEAKKMKDNNVPDIEYLDEVDDCVCFEPLSKSKSKETLVQFCEYKSWSHEACTRGEPQYI